MSDKVFDGIKVADFAWSGVGPMVSGYLAAHGATVVRIESHARPDVMRFAGPFKMNQANPNASIGFLQVHGNKWGLTLDLKNEKGNELAKRMIAWADVMTEAYVPGVMEKFGLGYEDASKINPGIIYYGTSMMGRFGPLAGMPGFGTFLTPMTGLNDIIGWPDRGPVQIYGALTDVVNFKYGIMAMTTALFHKKRTGEGQQIDLSQFAGGVTFCAEEILQYTANGKAWEKNGNRDEMAAPHGVFPTKGEDRWCAICIWSDDEFKKLADWMGKAELAEDARFATFEARKHNEDALEKIVAEWTQTQTNDRIVFQGQHRGLDVAPVTNNAELMQDKHMHFRKMFNYLEHEAYGTFPFHDIANDARLSETPAEITRRAPNLGEHTDKVMMELLQMSESEVADYRKAGAFGPVEQGA